MASAALVCCVLLASCASAPNSAYGAIAGRHGYEGNPILGSRQAAGAGSFARAPAARDPRAPGYAAGEDAIMGAGVADANRLVAFFLENNRGADLAKVRRMAAYYVETARVEGVNSDVAFAQMCLETGFLRFGALVTVDMNNFCGLGTTGSGHPGARFPDERTGVIAHVQHLKGYATAEALAYPLADPRYRYINPKGKAPTIDSLAGTWAADRAYGAKLRELVSKIRG
jgi:hypothetical protein